MTLHDPEWTLLVADAYRKLAKLCAKTSIVDQPHKLPEEALGFVTRGERAYTRRETREPSEVENKPKR